MRINGIKRLSGNKALRPCQYSFTGLRDNSNIINDTIKTMKSLKLMMYRRGHRNAVIVSVRVSMFVIVLICGIVAIHKIVVFNKMVVVQDSIRTTP